jgi:hypothetical protein
MGGVESGDDRDWKRVGSIRLSLLCALFAVLVLAPWTAMAQRFDVVTFDAPPGWTQQALGDGLMFETQPAPRAFCQIFLRKSRRPTAPLLQELDGLWSEMSQSEPLVAAPGDPGQLDLPSGFKVAQRVGQVYGTIRALNLLQKDNRLVPVVVNASGPDAVERCSTAIDNFMGSLRLDETSAERGSMTDARGANPADSPVPRSDPQLAARFGNSVVGNWRYGHTTAQTRNVIEVRFSRDGTYAIDVGGYALSETGTYRVEGQRILMRPRTADPGPYSLDWFFGDRPGSPGNWGLILRCSKGWLGSFGGETVGWRTFRPAE